MVDFLKQIVAHGDKMPKKGAVIQDIIPKSSRPRFAKKVLEAASRPLAD